MTAADEFRSLRDGFCLDGILPRRGFPRRAGEEFILAM